MRLIYIIIPAFVMLFSPVSFASDLFTVSGIEVSGNGKTATEAKENAIASGEEVAFKKLLERITPSFTRSLWPELSAVEISELVRGLDVNDEKITSSHYEAKLDISFNNLFVEKALKDAGVTYISKTSDPIILLPLLASGEEENLWTKNGQWKGAWEKAVEAASFINIVLPSSDSLNMASVATDALNIPLGEEIKTGLDGLKRRYKAEKILLATARTVEDQASIVVELTYLNEENPEKTTMRFYNKDDEDVDAVMARAASEILFNMDKRWKKSQESSKLSEASINISIPISGLDEWSGVNNKLRSYDFIKKMDVKYITVSYVSMDLSFQDGFENLVKKLALEGLYIENRDNSLYLMRYSTPPQWSEQEYGEASYEFEG